MFYVPMHFENQVLFIVLSTFSEFLILNSINKPPLVPTLPLELKYHIEQ